MEMENRVCMPSGFCSQRYAHLVLYLGPGPGPGGLFFPDMLSLNQSPDNQDAISVDTFCSEQSTSPTGDTDDVPEAKAPKRRALMASHPYHR